eukprot:s766_g4.t1
MPSLLRAIVNSLIPEDKKSKVEFVADADIPSTMRKISQWALPDLNRELQIAEGWLKKLGGPEADAYREALGGELDLPAAEDAPEAVPDSSASASQSPVPVLPDDFFNQDGVKAAVEDEDINKGRFIRASGQHGKEHLIHEDGCPEHGCRDDQAKHYELWLPQECQTGRGIVCGPCGQSIHDGTGESFDLQQCSSQSHLLKVPSTDAVSVSFLSQMPSGRFLFDSMRETLGIDRNKECSCFEMR